MRRHLALSLRSLSCCTTIHQTHSAKVDAEHSDPPASFASLPPELILRVLEFASTSTRTVAAFAQLDHRCADLAQHFIFARPCLTSLPRLDSFLRVVEPAAAGSRERANSVKRLRIEGKVFASRGYGHSLQRALKACPRVERLEVIGVDDLRPKQFLGSGTLTHLTLLNTSFRPHSHTSPPNLPSFLHSLTHLTFANVGLPAPSSHLTDILTLCAPTLRYLAISSLRDIDAAEFARGLQVLIDRGYALETLMLGFLTEQQVRVLHSPPPPPPPPPVSAPIPNIDPSPATGQPGRPMLFQLPALRHLTFTLPLPNLPLLLALPPTLRTLTIRPPYARPSTSTREHSRSSLLSILSRTPGTESPATPLASSSLSVNLGSGFRRMSVTLEQLEEEEAVIVAIEEALLQGAASGLEEIKWECRALRSAQGRLDAAMANRRRVQLNSLA